MIQRVWPLLLLLALATPAAADVWEDPDFQAAVREAELVARVRAPAQGSRGQPQVRFTVERVLEGGGGPPPGELLVGGFHDPTMTAGPTFQPSEVLYLVLVRREGGLAVPTPTLGRYPVREGLVRHATLRDTYLRLDLPEGDFERFVAVVRGRAPDPAWAAGLRQHLEAHPPEVEGPDRARAYLALETLALAGAEEDGPRAARFLVAESPYQLRISALRALAGALGKRAAGALLKAAREDPEPAVRTAAVRLLGAMDPPPERLVERLAELLPGAPERPIRFSGPNDPRLNRWPSPRAALLEAIGRRGAAPVKAAVLACLDGFDELETLSAALRALIPLRDDPGLPGELVARFQGPEQAGAELINRELCIALERLTGRDFGLDVARWRAWAAEESRGR